MGSAQEFRKRRKEVREGNGWRDEKENKNLMSTYYGARHYVTCFPTTILSTQQSEAVHTVLVVQTSKLRLGKVQWPHSEAV